MIICSVDIMLMDVQIPQPRVMMETDELSPGTVTRIARQKKNQERVSIYLNGAFAFGLHQDVLIQHELRKGLHLDVDRQRRLLASDEHIRARGRAFDLLAYRSRSALELSRRLKRDGFSDDSIEATMIRLRELRMLDDVGFARDYVRSRLANKGYGRHRIAAELRMRGIDRHTIDQVIAHQFEDDDVELEHARAFAMKRLPRLEREPDAARRRKKLYDALMRRGYDSDIVSRVIAECLTTP